MAKLNECYRDLKESYLFADIAKRVSAFSKAHPDKEIIRLGIGDVTLPLLPDIIRTLQNAAEELGDASSFHGYGPEQGYEFLRDSIRDYYGRYHVELEPDEIFISDGAKSDLGNITDLFARENTVLIPDPVYPVYVDTNIMNGRRILYADATRENGFLPLPDSRRSADLIYLCSPNNPTGAAYNREQLQQWVNYALERKAVILFDAAYEAFISDEKLPHSIYCIPGARKCAIEFCSLSKTAGFTGLRLGYTVVPLELTMPAANGPASLNQMWNRRQTTKFNGVSYPIQRCAQAAFSPEGMKQLSEQTAYYKENARLIGKTLAEKGIFYSGGENSPYIWLECPGGMDSWEFFDYLLLEAAVVGTPGAGFGANGNRYLRLTGFGDRDKTLEAMKRLEGLL